METEKITEDFTLYVQTFGCFKISGAGKELSAEGMRSEMLLRLLAYVLCYRSKILGVQELADILWPDGSSDNPAGALKNLMYRLRNILKKTWGDYEFILTGRGSYQWNPHIKVSMDAEEFEKGCREWENTSDESESVKSGVHLVEIYRGRFLTELCWEYWVISMSTYYHSRYMSFVKKLSAWMEETKHYSKIESICENAILQEPLDEEIHGFYLRALIADNKQKLAMEHYEETVKLLYDNLGVQPSKELRVIYDELLKEQHKHEADIHVIQEELQEAGGDSGAFLCEYGVFKHMYILEARSSARLGITVHLVLLTLYPTVPVKEGSKEYLALIGKSMEILQTVLRDSLRSSDILCRYSGSQYLVMLPACQYEDVLMVTERIQKNYYKSDKKSKVRIQYSVNEIGLSGK